MKVLALALAISYLPQLLALPTKPNTGLLQEVGESSVVTSQGSTSCPLKWEGWCSPSHHAGLTLYQDMDCDGDGIVDPLCVESNAAGEITGAGHLSSLHNCADNWPNSVCQNLPQPMRGAKGVKGDPGPRGPIGIVKGPTGDKGPTGEKGEKGPTGYGDPAVPALAQSMNQKFAAVDQKFAAMNQKIDQKADYSPPPPPDNCPPLTYYNEKMGKCVM